MLKKKKQKNCKNFYFKKNRLSPRTILIQRNRSESFSKQNSPITTLIQSYFEKNKSSINN
jgi:hypothetical protein